MISLLYSLIAQIDPASMPTALDYGEALQMLVQSLGGIKGAGALVVAGIIVQGLMILARTKLGDYAGKWRWVIYTGLSLVAGVLALRVSDVSWTGALVHSTTLAAVGNWLHQLVKQVTTKEEA
jgi:type IV secretory pathway VirB2 component (pilin)